MALTETKLRPIRLYLEREGLDVTRPDLAALLARELHLSEAVAREAVAALAGEG